MPLLTELFQLRLVNYKDVAPTALRTKTRAQDGEISAAVLASGIGFFNLSL
jgi:hypothetical protein